MLCVPPRYLPRLLAWIALTTLPPLLAACGDERPPAWSGYAEGDPVYVAAPLAGQLMTLDVQRGDTIEAGVALFTVDETPMRHWRTRTSHGSSN